MAQSQLEAVTAILRERGPILTSAGYPKTVCGGVLYTGAHDGERARALFESVMRQRLERLGANSNFALAVTEEVNTVARSLQHLLRTKPTAILLASTTAPAGSEDVIGQAMALVGCHLELFLAPVEPGNLFLLGP